MEKIRIRMRHARFWLGLHVRSSEQLFYLSRNASQKTQLINPRWFLDDELPFFQFSVCAAQLNFPYATIQLEQEKTPADAALHRTRPLHCTAVNSQENAGLPSLPGIATGLTLRLHRRQGREVHIVPQISSSHGTVATTRRVALGVGLELLEGVRLKQHVLAALEQI